MRRFFGYLVIVFTVLAIALFDIQPQIEKVNYVVNKLTAANIATAIDNFKDRGYASLGGVILNKRNVKNEEEKVDEFI